MKHTYLSVAQVKARQVRHKKRAVFPAKKVGGAALWGSVKAFCPAPFDQGQLGSCTANAFCGAYMTLSNKQKTPDAGWIPSRLWVYYWERVLENPGSNPQKLGDTGADVTDAESYARAHGICSESLWIYDPTKFDQKPTASMIADAQKHKIKASSSIAIDTNLLANIEAAVSGGRPVLIAIAVYQSFEGDKVASNGMVPLPNPVNYEDPNDPQDPFLGGHELCLVGFSHDKQLFTVLNSWGAAWGDKGFCYIPYAYLANPKLGSEFTVIDI